MTNVAPRINSDKEERWDEDLKIAEGSIKTWLASYRPPGESRSELETRLARTLVNSDWGPDLAHTIEQSPEVLTTLRSLTRRDMGTAQFADFVGVGESVLSKFEQKLPTRTLPIDFSERCRDLILSELDSELGNWILQQRPPTPEEVSKAVTIASDRLLRRRASTSLRYAHEPRQLGILSGFLDGLGYQETSGGTLTNPRMDMAPGTYSFRRSVAGSMVGGGDLMQSVDVVLKPLGSSTESSRVWCSLRYV